MAMADDAQASADMAKADLDAMMADAFQPSAVMISDGQIDPSRASFAEATSSRRRSRHRVRVVDPV